MKRIIKNNIFGFILGIIIMSGIGVLAINYLYNSTDVLYEKSDKTQVSVKESLDDLYSIINKPTKYSEYIMIYGFYNANGYMRAASQNYDSNGNSPSNIWVTYPTTSASASTTSIKCVVDNQINNNYVTFTALKKGTYIIYYNSDATIIEANAGDIIVNHKSIYGIFCLVQFITNN